MALKKENVDKIKLNSHKNYKEILKNITVMMKNYRNLIM